MAPSNSQQLMTQAAVAAQPAANGSAAGTAAAAAVKQEASPAPSDAKAAAAAAAASGGAGDAARRSGSPSVAAAGGDGSARATPEAAAAAGAAGTADAAPSKEDEEQRNLEDEILAEGQAIAGVRALLAKAFRWGHMLLRVQGRRLVHPPMRVCPAVCMAAWHNSMQGCGATVPAFATVRARLPECARNCTAGTYAVLMLRFLLPCSRPAEEPAVALGHWGFLLREAEWLANDMAQVRLIWPGCNVFHCFPPVICRSSPWLPAC